MAQYFERRSATSINYKSPIRVEDLKGIIYNARIVNYSNEGLYIETDWLLKPGTEIYIEMTKSPYSPSNFELSERRQWFECCGSCRHDPGQEGWLSQTIEG